jgi:hypothetical protein
MLAKTVGVVDNEEDPPIIAVEANLAAEGAWEPIDMVEAMTLAHHALVISETSLLVDEMTIDRYVPLHHEALADEVTIENVREVQACMMVGAETDPDHLVAEVGGIEVQVPVDSMLMIFRSPVAHQRTYPMCN